MSMILQQTIIMIKRTAPLGCQSLVHLTVVTLTLTLVLMVVLQTTKIT